MSMNIDKRARAGGLLAAIGLLAVLTPASAAPITGLFATGVDAAGNALPAGSADPHYSIVAPSQPAIVVKDAIPATWLPNNATSRWVWETAQGAPTGSTSSPVTRSFRLSFDLAGLDPATALISGSWATDNFGADIFINGASTGNTCGGFGSLCSFTVASGFQSGVNTLDFQVQDFGVISGLLVRDIGGTADAVAAVPAPSSLALAGIGLLGLRSRRARARAR